MSMNKPVKSYAHLTCETEEQLTAMDTYTLPSEISPEHIKRNGRIITFENCLTEGGFENDITGIVSHIARTFPGKKMVMVGTLLSEDSYYYEEIIVDYNGVDIHVQLKLEDRLFKNGKVCAKCQTDMNAVYHQDGFQCPHCHAQYVPVGHENTRDADFVFGDESFTYCVPHEHI